MGASARQDCHMQLSLVGCPLQVVKWRYLRGRNSCNDDRQCRRNASPEPRAQTAEMPLPISSSSSWAHPRGETCPHGRIGLGLLYELLVFAQHERGEACAFEGFHYVSRRKNNKPSGLADCF